MSGPVFGQADPSTDANDYNVMQFIVAAAIAKMQTVSVVEVMAVHGGGVGPTGTVDVQVIVNLMTGNGAAVPHGVIYGVPFTRSQGGKSAFVCDPAVGDIGMAAFASRDITSVKNTRGTANPSSKRMFDWADAIYVSGMLNNTPSQYIQMTDDVGITIQASNEATLPGGAVNILGGTNQSGAQGGTVTIQGGANENDNQGGNIIIGAGEGDVSNGYVFISAAGGDVPNPGDVFLLTDTTLTLYSNGNLVAVIGGSAGVAGQTLISDGAGNVAWSTPGASGTFESEDGKTVTVVGGLIVSIV